MTSKSTACPGLTGVARVAIGSADTAGRLLYVVFASDQAPGPGSVYTAPPTRPPSLLPLPAVSRRMARSTANGPTPLTWKRRSAWRIGEPPARSPGAVPKTFVGAAASTYVSATAVNASAEGLMVTRTLLATVTPSRSVTVAVSVCGPSGNAGIVSVAPAPSGPPRLDAHRTAAPRSPSSTSVAEAARTTGRLASSAAPSAGAWTVMTGRTLGGRITTLRVASAASPPPSRTRALMTCVPIRSALAVMLAPVPRSPSRLDVQWIALERMPSVTSVALPVKTSGVPWNTRVPSAGATIVTAGGVGFTVKLTLAVPVASSESRAAAVRTCTPSWRRTTVRVAPAPRSPSRLDDQRMAALGSGSKSSVAVAARVTGVPANADPSPGGAVMVTTGAVFGPRTRRLIRASPGWPLESVADAVIVCVPMRSEEDETCGPVPRAPSRLDVHWSAALTSPSSTSVATPLNATVVPSGKTAWFGGAVMATTGALPESASTSFGGVAVSRER